MVGLRILGKAGFILFAACFELGGGFAQLRLRVTFAAFIFCKAFFIFGKAFLILRASLFERGLAAFDLVVEGFNALKVVRPTAVELCACILEFLRGVC